MVVLLILLALVLIATGGAAIVFGSPIVQVERGWTMVISGSVAASAGFVLLGIALSTLRLGRITRELMLIRDRLGSLGQSLEEVALPASAPVARQGYPAQPPRALPPDMPPPDMQPPMQPPVSAPLPPVIVGQYQSGGNSYVMYADGSVLADTPGGQHRFDSLDELRGFVAGGGERH